MVTNFKEILARLERPYWSPLHPRRYVKRIENGNRPQLIGWGMCYPEDIGAFNLMWLLSGAGAPPDDYNRYTTAVMFVLQCQDVMLGRRTLKEAAAMLTIDQFARDVRLAASPQLAPIAAALRLRV